MSWEIVTGFIVLFGFVGSVGTYIFKLANILTKLETAVDNLRETLNMINDTNKQEHARFFNMIDKLDSRLTIVETKIDDQRAPD